MNVLILGAYGQIARLVEERLIKEVPDLVNFKYKLAAWMVKYRFHFHRIVRG